MKFIEVELAPLDDIERGKTFINFDEVSSFNHHPTDDPDTTRVFPSRFAEGDEYWTIKGTPIQLFMKLHGW